MHNRVETKSDISIISSSKWVYCSSNSMKWTASITKRSIRMLHSKGGALLPTTTSSVLPHRLLPPSQRGSLLWRAQINSCCYLLKTLMRCQKKIRWLIKRRLRVHTLMNPIPPISCPLCQICRSFVNVRPIVALLDICNRLLFKILKKMTHMEQPKGISMFFRLRTTLTRCLSMRILLWSQWSMQTKPTTRRSGQATTLTTMCLILQPNNTVWAHQMEIKTIIKLLEIKT